MTYKPSTLSFYRPHDRSATWYTGELVNEVTGEVYIPPTIVKQSFVEECDINNILKQYKLTGQIRHMRAGAQQGHYEDLPDQSDFQEAMNLVLAAEASFATLPSHVRARFANNPAEFLGFMADPSNAEEIVKLGLATIRPPTPENDPPDTPPAPPAPPPAK